MFQITYLALKLPYTLNRTTEDRTPSGFQNEIQSVEKPAISPYTEDIPMKTRIFAILCASLIGFGVVTVQAEEAKEEEAKKEKKETPAKAAFLNRWKKIQSVNKKRAYETQQTRTVAGVRGAEAEDAILDQLYYKGGVRYPSRVDLKNAITQLQDAIKAEPKADTVPEQKFFIAQCHVQLGESTDAKAVYQDLAKNYGATEFGKLAQEELDKMK